MDWFVKTMDHMGAALWKPVAGLGVLFALYARAKGQG